MLSVILKMLRENNGYTQQQIADALNVERSTYTCYEIGKTMPDVNTIIKLAKIFNVPYSYILSEEARYLDADFNDIDVNSLDFVYKDSQLLNHTYELTKDEKKLIASFRALPSDSKKKIMNNVSKEIKNNSKK